VVRTAGDEKVYVQQALEMWDRGSLFVQTLFNVPDYYKGPFHFWLALFGIKTLGLHALAIFYFHPILIVLGGWSMVRVVERLIPESQSKTPTSVFSVPLFWGLVFCSGVGLYAHAFASQMEVSLACLFALAMERLTSKGPRAEFYFWIVAGIVGWIKSPLHSVFLGLAGCLHFLFEGTLLSRLKSPRSWLAVAAGIGTCILGYVPTAALDFSNFYARYIQKETVQKSTSGQHWSVALVPIVSFYFLPWIFFAIAG